MTAQITASDLIREVRAVAEEHPDFTYANQEGYDPRVGCSYVGAAIGDHEGRGCIVGQALERLEFNMEAVKGWELSEASEGTSVTDLMGHFQIPATYAEKNWLAGVQSSQDHGESWGFAVKSTDAAYKLSA